MKNSIKILVEEILLYIANTKLISEYIMSILKLVNHQRLSLYLINFISFIRFVTYESHSLSI